MLPSARTKQNMAFIYEKYSNVLGSTVQLVQCISWYERLTRKISQYLKCVKIKPKSTTGRMVFSAFTKLSTYFRLQIDCSVCSVRSPLSFCIDWIRYHSSFKRIIVWVWRNFTWPQVQMCGHLLSGLQVNRERIALYGCLFYYDRAKL